MAGNRSNGGLDDRGPTDLLAESAELQMGIGRARLADVVEAVLRERTFQVMCYPQTAPRSVSSHVLVMDVELLEAKLDAVKGSHKRADALREVLQVVACGIACLMENGIAERSMLADLVRKCGPLARSGVEEAGAAFRAAERVVAGERLAGFAGGTPRSS